MESGEFFSIMLITCFKVRHLVTSDGINGSPAETDGHHGGGEIL